MQKGDVKFFSESKGFGFITNTDDGKDYFFHHSVVEDGPVAEGDQVEFDGHEGDKGPRAEKVKRIETPPSFGRTPLNDANVQVQ